MAATVTLRMRPRVLSGPAVRRPLLPVRSLLVSSVGHAIVVGGIIVAALLGRPEPTRTYIVNLTPSVPALGSPAGKVATAAPPCRRRGSRRRPAPAKSAPSELPAPEVGAEADEIGGPRAARAGRRPEVRSSGSTAGVARAHRGPGARHAHARGAEAAAAKGAALPRVRRACPSVECAEGGRHSDPARGGASAAPAPAGATDGRGPGAGTAASVEGDFPFQWYLTAVQRKVYEQWTQPLSTPPGQKAVIVFEIARSGEVIRARVEKTSGDAAYDLAALRAVTAANPLPPLPSEFKGTVIRVHFGFEYTGRG